MTGYHTTQAAADTFMTFGRSAALGPAAANARHGA
jgi:hypothetical protein